MLAQSFVLSLLAVNAALAREINMMIGWTHVAGLNSWQFWPYTDGKYDTACVVQSTWTAEIYAVPDVNNPPRQLAWAIPFLDEYWRTDDGGDMPYPGDFYDFMHRDGFRVIATPYERLPWAVKQWRDEQIEKNTFERKFIAVKDDVAFFAPGVVTLLLPLFAGQDVVPGNDACESKYVNCPYWSILTVI